MLFRCAIKWFGIASLIFAFSLYFTKISKGRPEKKPVLLFKMGVTRYRDSGEFYQGEPIFIHLGLRRMDTNETPREKPLRIGTEQLPWYKNVSFCLYKFEEEPEDKRLPRTSSNDASRASSAAESPIEDIRNKETSGSNSVPVSSSTAEPTREETKYENIIDKNAHTKKATLIEDVNVSLIGPQPKKNKLKIHDSVRSFWVVEPNFTSKLLPGKYMIQATFDTTDKWESHPKIFHGKYLSNEVNLVINQPQRDTVRAKKPTRPLGKIIPVKRRRRKCYKRVSSICRMGTFLESS